MSECSHEETYLDMSNGARRCADCGGELLPEPTVTAVRPPQRFVEQPPVLPIALNTITEGNCLDLLPRVATASVDMVLCDLPYGTTQNKWDSVIPFEALWAQYRRVCKPGAAIVLTAAQPFITDVVDSNRLGFRYSWVWVKTNCTGFANAKKQPLRAYEDILVFYAATGTYNPQGTQPCVPRVRTKKTGEIMGRTGFKDGYIQTQSGYPKNVLEVPSERGLHPTQKPVALWEYLIRTYTNEGDTVLDNCCGSGTTGVACQNTGRNFIQFELSAEYCEIARGRLLKAEPKQPADDIELPEVA